MPSISSIHDHRPGPAKTPLNGLGGVPIYYRGGRATVHPRTYPPTWGAVIFSTHCIGAFSGWESPAF